MKKFLMILGLIIGLPLSMVAMELNETVANMPVRDTGSFNVGVDSDYYDQLDLANVYIRTAKVIEHYVRRVSKVIEPLEQQKDQSPEKKIIYEELKKSFDEEMEELKSIKAGWISYIEYQEVHKNLCVIEERVLGKEIDPIAI